MNKKNEKGKQTNLNHSHHRVNGKLPIATIYIFNMNRERRGDGVMREAEDAFFFSF